MATNNGLAALKRKLDAIPRAAKRAVEESMEKSAAEIVALARRLCPVDSGDLRDSIGWTWGDAPEGSIVLAQTKGGLLRIAVYAGDDKAFYGRWVEHGTAAMAAHPFFFPAYRSLQKRAKSRINRAVNKAVKEAFAE